MPSLHRGPEDLYVKGFLVCNKLTDSEDLLLFFSLHLKQNWQQNLCTTACRICYLSSSYSKSQHSNYWINSSLSNSGLFAVTTADLCHGRSASLWPPTVNLLSQEHSWLLSRHLCVCSYTRNVGAKGARFFPWGADALWQSTCLRIHQRVLCVVHSQSGLLEPI